jgi:hypothetical protein
MRLPSTAAIASAIASSIVNNVMVDRLCLAIVDLPAGSVVVRAMQGGETLHRSLHVEAPTNLTLTLIRYQTIIYQSSIKQRSNNSA